MHLSFGKYLETYRFVKKYVEIAGVPPEVRLLRFTEAPQGRLAAVRISKAEDVASYFAVLAWVQIAVRSALFEDETKRVGIARTSPS